VSMSSYLGSARSLSPAVRNCLLVVMFRSLRYYFELQAEETRLRGAGFLEVPSVLAAHGPPSSTAPSTQSRSPALPILPTPQG
jgi:hypothetical protein